MCLFSNGQILELLLKTRAGIGKIQKDAVSLNDVNVYASKCIAGQFNPIKSPGIFRLWDLVTDVSPIPSMKLCQLSSSDEDEYGTWADMTTSLLKSSPPQPRKSLCSRLIYRGCLDQRPPQQCIDRFSNRMGCITNPAVYFSSISKKPSISACTNSTDSLSIVEPFLARSREMYHERAYVHWYERYEKDSSAMFVEAFESVENIVHNYRSLL